MQELDTFEDDLIERYRRHPVLEDIGLLPDEDFTAILLQRRFLSLAFTPAYDLAIDLLRDETALRTARLILREEYPDTHGYTPSHREDMTRDMEALGVSRQALVRTRPTPRTRRIIDDTFALITDAGTPDAPADADLRLLTVLRFWGEILVSVEYGRLWERMEPTLTREGEGQSLFYYPHHWHDAKARPLATPALLALNHPDRLATRLRELLADAGEDGAAAFREMEERSLGLKTGFYDQFLPALDRARSRV
ncbi:hypothetical protein ACWFQ8_14850 [Streptomyces sp. NPDC055254]